LRRDLLDYGVLSQIIYTSLLLEEVKVEVLGEVLRAILVWGQVEVLIGGGKILNDERRLEGEAKKGSVI